MGPSWQLPGPAQPDQPWGFQAFYQVCQKLLKVGLSIVGRCMWYLAFVSSIKALPSLNHIASSHPFLSSTHRKNQDKIVHIKIQNSGDYYDLYRNEKVTTLGDVVGYYMENPGTLREVNGRVIELRNALNALSHRYAHARLSSFYPLSTFTASHVRKNTRLCTTSMFTFRTVGAWKRGYMSTYGSTVSMLRHLLQKL